MTTTLTPVQFTFDDDNILFDGFADGSTWNGFDNVRVEADVREAIALMFETRYPEETDTPADFRAIPVGDDGLVNLGGGYATIVID